MQKSCKLTFFIVGLKVIKVIKLLLVSARPETDKPGTG